MKEKVPVEKEEKAVVSPPAVEPSPGIELTAVRRNAGEESCPVCRETPDSKHALTCVSCRAKYHLGCIAESRSRRCVTCQSRVLPPARLHIERIRRGISWRPTILAILFAMAIFALSTVVKSQMVWVMYLGIMALATYKKAQENREQERKERVEKIKAQRELMEKRARASTPEHPNREVSAPREEQLSPLPDDFKNEVLEESAPNVNQKLDGDSLKLKG